LLEAADLCDNEREETRIMNLKPLPIRWLVPFTLLAGAVLLGPMARAQSRPTVITQPQGMIVSPGSTVTLSVEAAGDPPFAYRWRRNAITVWYTTTNEPYVIPNLRTGAVYTVVVTNLYGVTISRGAPVTCFRLERTSQGNVLDLNGATNTAYELQYIPDVISTNWIGLTNFVMPSKTNVFRFVDTEATNASHRFYRAVVMP
jgi:hypothetical protein